MTGFQVMLAPHDEPKKNPTLFDGLKFPLYVSPKLDGIRSVVKEGRCKSRKYIDLPSEQVQHLWGSELYNHLDGEMIIGDPTDHDVYNRTQSSVMSRSKPTTDLSYWLFDYPHPDLLNAPFDERIRKLHDRVEYLDTIGAADNLYIIEQHLVNNIEELLAIEDMYLNMGYEGVMMKAVNGRYKCGRGTYKEGLIYKLKRFTDDEAVIVKFIERQKNLNEQVRDDLGNAKRSSHKDNKIGINSLGKFIALYKDMEIEVAPGVLKKEELKEIWDNQDKYMGKIIKFRHFAHGVKDKPRFPRFVGFRDKIDM